MIGFIACVLAILAIIAVVAAFFYENGYKAGSLEAKDYWYNKGCKDGEEAVKNMIKKRLNNKLHSIIIDSDIYEFKEIERRKLI